MATQSTSSFFKELKHRRVYRVAIGYGIVGSALVQVVGTVLPIFHAPDWMQQLFVVLLALGFPIALVLAWAFDITTTGIERTPDVRGLRATHARQIWLLALAGTLIAGFAVAGYWFWHPWRAASGSLSPSLGLTSSSIPEKSIAVLPFQNLSAEKENAFFTDGVQDEILTNLAKVSDLKVISRWSVQQYKTGVARDLRMISQQLGIAYILVGSVQRVPDRLRVSAQLIDARNDSQIWAATYDREVADLFKIQSEIAQSIVTHLQAKLSPQEKANIEERPTTDLAAFDLYLQAKEIVDTYLEAADPGASLLRTVRLLDEAIERDPNFALAYCYLARAHDLLYFLDLDPSPARNLLAEAAVTKALQLRPNLPEAHVAMADHHFRCHRDYERAQQELAIARPNLPNSVSFFFLAGYIERRRGQWPEAERDFASAVTIDPRNPNAVNLVVDTYVLERRFPEGKRAYDRAIAAGLQQPIAYIRRAAMDFGETGESTTLRAALNKWPEVDVGGGETAWRIMLAMIDRNFDAADRVLAQSARADFQEVDFSFYYPRAWYEAIIARARADQAKALRAFSDARAVFESRLQLKPEDPRTLAVLAQVDAGLGRKELAIREAKHAVELMPISRDAYDAPLVQQGLAQVYVWTGEKDQALQLLEQLVSIPSYLSYGYLRFDPQWEPLHGDARFEKIVASIAPKQFRN
jgi:TolB-like protein/Tfp pilus assembly protein PilF